MSNEHLRFFSQASENNRLPIETELRRIFADKTHILEIGSGTGQHAVYFSSALPHLVWQTSDLVENHEGICHWLSAHGGNNVCPPLTLDVTQHPWTLDAVDGIFTANTSHIMPWEAVVEMFEGTKTVLKPKGTLVIYGPFNYDGEFTSESNRRFEQWLKDRGAHQGIRDFEKMVELATEAKLTLKEDLAMPANNRLLVFEKT